LEPDKRPVKKDRNLPDGGKPVHPETFWVDLGKRGCG